MITYSIQSTNVIFTRWRFFSLLFITVLLVSGCGGSSANIDTESPTAIVDLVSSSSTVEQGEDFTLSGRRSYDTGGGSISKYHWQAISPTAQLGDFSSGKEIVSSSETLLINASADVVPAGLQKYQLIVEDDSGNFSAPASISVIVTDTQAPTAVLDLNDKDGNAITGGNIDQGQDFILSGRYSSDTNGGSISQYHWRAINAEAQIGVFSGGAEVVTSTNSLLISASSDILPAGVQAYQLVVEDASGNLSAADEIQAIIVAIDTFAPTALLDLASSSGAIISDGNVELGIDFILSGQRSSDTGGGSIIKYHWQAMTTDAQIGEFSGGKEVVTSAATLLVTASANAIPAGSQRYQLVVEDTSGNLSAPATMPVTVMDTQAPTAILDLSDKDGNAIIGGNIDQGQDFILSGKRSSDANGGSISQYHWRAVNTEAQIGMFSGGAEVVTSANTLLITASTDTLPPGLQTYQLIVEDASGNLSAANEASVSISTAGTTTCSPPCGVTPLADASVSIYQLEKNGDRTLLFTDTSSGGDLSTAGQFYAHIAELNDTTMYLYEISGGNDIDADRDGVLDGTATVNLGTWHLFARGSELKTQGQLAVSMASDILYKKFRCQLQTLPYDIAQSEINTAVNGIIGDDINADASIDIADILIFDPVLDADKLSPIYQRKRFDILAAIHADDRFYFSGALDYVSKLSFVPANMAFSADSNMAFSVGGNQLKIIDISDRENMIVRATLDITGAQDVAVSADDKTLYIAVDNSSGLQVVDISNPDAPAITDSNSLGLGGLTVVAISHDGSTLFTASTASKNLYTIDLSSSTISLQGNIAVSDGDNFYNIEVSSDDTRLFVATSSLHVFDVSNSSSPSELANYTAFSGANDLKKVVLSQDESTAYVVRYQAVDILNITNAVNGNITKLGSKDITYNFYYPGSAAVYGNVLYLMNVDYGIFAYDISDPANPVQVDASVNTSVNYGPMELTPDGSTLFAGDFRAYDTGDASGSVIAGRYIDLSEIDAVALSADNTKAYMLDNNSGKFKVIDISDEHDLTSSSVLGELSGVYGSQIVLNSTGTRAWVASGSTGVRVIDISDPSTPALINTFDTTGSALTITFNPSGNRAYIADDSTGLVILDISDENNITLVSSLDTAGSVKDIVLSSDGKNLFLAARESGVQTIDISDETSPSLVNTFNEGSKTFYASSLALSADGNRLFVGGGGTSAPSGFSILDVSTASAPVSLATIATSDTRRITLSPDETRAYLADGGSSSGNLKIVDISDMANVHLVGGVIKQAFAHTGLDLKVSSDGTRAYLADGQAGMFVVNICE